jgi:UDP-N-acetylmuramoyl-tripeptide--D-alanyl-D-alanine ligase
LISLAQIREGIGEHRLPNQPVTPQPFTGVVIDSRQATPGVLFVALRGEETDGHRYIQDAHKRGAAGVIVEGEVPLEWMDPEERAMFTILAVPDSLQALQSLARYWRRQHTARVIAITGSIGKTTSRQMVEAVLSRKYRTLASEANLNTETGVPLTLLRLDESHQRAVIEMGMYDLGEIATLCRIAEPDTGIVTNVGPSHLERLGTIERIAQAKGELPASLPAGGWAILNGDDPRVRSMPTQAQPVLYGLGADSEVGAEEVDSRGVEGLRFRLRLGGRSFQASTPVMGRHLIYACLAAAAAGYVNGMKPEDILEGLANPPPTLRFRVLPGPNGSHIIDDTYNASPASTIAALDFLAEMPGRRTAVLGDMLELGPMEAEGHRQVGRRAVETVDRLVVVGERARLIGEAAMAAGLGAVQFAAAKDDVQLEFDPSGWVLIKGSRGMRMEELVARWASKDTGNEGDI